MPKQNKTDIDVMASFVKEIERRKSQNALDKIEDHIKITLAK